MDLLLIRHGRSLADDEHRIEGGGYDAPLTNEGVEQARKLAARLRNESYSFDSIFCSPLIRAKQTAQIVSDALGIELELDDRLAELHLGALSGLPIGIDPEPEAFQLAYKKFPDGEAFLDQIQRVMSFYLEIQDKHANSKVCIVAHGGTLNVLIALILGLPMGSPYWQCERLSHYERMNSEMEGRTVKRVLITGMSATGKSTIVRELAARGYRAIDTDYDGFSHWIDMSTGLPAPPPAPGEYAWDKLDWVWNEDRIAALLSDCVGDSLVVAGTAINQGKFYRYFNHIVLLSAPVSVIVERLANRTDNSYGTTPRTRSRVLHDIQSVEPLLRKRADYEIDTSRPLEEVLDEVIRLIAV